MISDAFSIYGSNLGALLLTGLGIAVVFGIVVGLLNDSDSFILQLIGSILQLVAAAIYTGFVVKLVQDVRDGKRDQSVGELISSAMPALGSLIVFSVLSSIAIMIGFFLLDHPGPDPDDHLVGRRAVDRRRGPRADRSVRPQL